MKKHALILIIAIVLIAGVAVAGEKKALSPDVNGKFDLGQSDRQWKDVRITNDLIVDGTVVIDDGTIVAGQVGGITASGDATGTLASGDMALTLSVNSVSAPQLYTNTTTFTILPGQTGNTQTVPSGSVLLSVYPLSGFSNTEVITNAVISGTSFVINTTAATGTNEAIGVYMMP